MPVALRPGRSRLAATVTRNFNFLGVPAVHQSATRTTLNWVLRENSIYGHKFHFFLETDFVIKNSNTKKRGVVGLLPLPVASWVCGELLG
jgi:hypothetical protein